MSKRPAQQTDGHIHKLMLRKKDLKHCARQCRVVFFLMEKNKKRDMNVFYYKKAQNQSRPLLDSNETGKQNKTKLSV